MNPVFDQLAVGAIIAGALGFFARQIFRRKTAGKGCGSGCCTPRSPLLREGEDVSRIARN